MSAIAGFWSRRETPEALANCRAMLAAQAVYGPDDESADEVASLALGRRLYSLLPEDAWDRQPVTGGDRGLALVADVRLDNREELAALLGLAGSLRQTADSEILFRALERWGPGAVERIAGDFAFAFYDGRERQLLLARDPLGQRPLFWCRRRDYVAFASMPKGLHALADLERRPDLQAIARFTAALPQEGPRSWFEGISRVEPGHMVIVTAKDERTRRYWRPARRDLGLKTFQDHVEAYRAELDRAVRCRLRTSEPVVASHLSGGWDSSAVSATAARLLAPGGGRLLALTSVPGRPPGVPDAPTRFSDEGPLASATASLYPNMDHLLVRSGGASALRDLDRYEPLFERPLHNLCNHVWLSEVRAAAASGGARVLLSGEIGNWTISAAPNALLADFVREGRWRDWAGAAAALLRSGRGRLRGIAVSSFAPWIPAPLWKRLLAFAPTFPMGEMSPLNPSLADLVREQEERELSLTRPRDNFEHTAAAIMEMDWGELRKGILGGWGVDKRDATADPRLIEFCLSLPLEMLLDRGVRRPLARAALSDRLPPAVLEEKRKGYQGVDWFAGLSADRRRLEVLVEAIAEDPDGAAIFNVDLLSRLVREWPTSGWEEPRTRLLYRVALLHAMSGAHFLLAAKRGLDPISRSGHSEAGTTGPAVAQCQA